jgi:UDP-glucuronate 4-epimerase
LAASPVLGYNSIGMKTVLVTGGAGFIGSHLCQGLLARGDRVICLDNFNDFYDPRRKRQNIAPFAASPHFSLVHADLRDPDSLAKLFAEFRPTHVAHLAAMANPRRSIQNPTLYCAVNVQGTLNLLEACQAFPIQALVLFSTSSVYGLSGKPPFREDEPADRPLSPYGATKRASELLAYTWHYLHGTPTTIIRPFTVYGPRGRPDMTPWLFVDAMRQNKPITLYNGGRNLFRDYTYVGDFIPGVIATLDRALPFEIINLGNDHPVEICHFIDLLQRITGLQAIIQEKPLPRGEPTLTHADLTKARTLLGYNPATSLEAGLSQFWEWYQAQAK